MSFNIFEKKTVSYLPFFLRCIESSSRKYSTFSENDRIPILNDFINRNPRSMELLRIARKPQGYYLDTPKINFWYRLQLQISHKSLSGWVEHHSGRKVVMASTNEWGLCKQLYSIKDSSAAINLGRVLARRCLQSGIYEVHTDLEKQAKTSQKVKLFLDALIDGGISLGEAPQIREKHTYSNVRQMPTFPWQVSEEDMFESEIQNRPDKTTKE